MRLEKNPFFQISLRIEISSEAMIFAVMKGIFAIAQRSLKNSGLQRGLNK